MPSIAEAAAAATLRRRANSNGTEFWFTSYIGPNRYRPAASPPAPGTPMAVAFLVEQDPGTTVAAHFHQADQFQLIVGGGGTLGRHAVAPGTVHFVGAYSAYGPIVAGDRGLSYFTLRNGWDPGARYMPGARGELPRQRLHREAAGAAIDAAPDGLMATPLTLAPGTALTDPLAGGDRFWVVLEGAIQVADDMLGPRSCMFTAASEAAPQASAGETGARVMMMRFPARAG
jgi:hypothetical protein